MRRELIQALGYPRLLIRLIIDDRDCPHDGVFEAASERCRGCNIKSSCHWLNRLDEFENFDGKPTYMINASLRYAIGMVEDLHKDLEHDQTPCSCEPCSWVRDARRLTAEFEEQLPPNPYRP